MEQFLNKKYKLDRTENFEAMMREMGINSVMIKIAKTFTTVVQLTKKGDLYSLNSTIMLFSTSQKFKLGEGKNVTTTDGRKVINIFEIEGNKLIEKQIGEKTLIIEREFYEDQMIAKAGFENGEICTSWCKVVPT